MQSRLIFKLPAVAGLEQARDRICIVLPARNCVSNGRIVQPVLRPSAPPAANLQLSLPLLPLAASTFNLRLSSVANLPTRPRANPPARIGVVSPGSISGKYRAFAPHYALPIDWLLTLQLALASGLQLGLRSLPTHIWRRPSARPVSQLPVFTDRCRNISACAGCCCNPQLALAAAPFATPVRNPRLASAVPPPALPVSNSRGLRRANLPPVGPLMHPLLQPNLASPAEPSMSIPYPPVRAPSGSAN